MKIGDKLKKMREIKKMSQQEVAHLLHISQKKYSNIERDRSNLTIESLSSISVILEFDLVELLQEQGVVIYNQKSKKDSESTVLKNEYTKILMDQYQSNIKEKAEVIILLKEKIERLEKDNLLLEDS